MSLMNQLPDSVLAKRSYIQRLCKDLYTGLDKVKNRYFYLKYRSEVWGRPKELKRRLQEFYDYSGKLPQHLQLKDVHFGGWMQFGVDKDPKKRKNWIKLFQPRAEFLGYKPCDYIPGEWREVTRGYTLDDWWIEIYGIKYTYTMIISDMREDLLKRIKAL